MQMSISTELAQSFDERYAGTPGWDIPGPQSAIVRLAEAGLLSGPILDAGCGTGENTLFCASRGLAVLGFDFSAVAIAKAVRKAEERKSPARFLVYDACRLPVPGEQQFSTAIDTGLFHVFSDNARVKFVNGLRQSLKIGGIYYMLCFSELEPGDWGPRRISQKEIRSSFSGGWAVISIDESHFDTVERPEPVKAWLASVRRES
jgi:SAM-dependent methyltransferase